MGYEIIVGGIFCGFKSNVTYIVCPKLQRNVEMNNQTAHEFHKQHFNESNLFAEPSSSMQPTHGVTIETLEHQQTQPDNVFSQETEDIQVVSSHITKIPFS